MQLHKLRLAFDSEEPEYDQRVCWQHQSSGFWFTFQAEMIPAFC